MERYIHNDISLQLSVIPGLTRNPVFFWIPASAGMTYSYPINDAVYRYCSGIKGFTGIGFYDRKRINPFLIKVDLRIELHPFRPEDFTEDNPFFKEILKQGIEI